MISSYWGYEHSYSTMVASIREGGLIEKQATLVQEPQPQMSPNDQELHSPRLPKRTPAWHTLPFCVKDPFIRKKVMVHPRLQPCMC